MATRETSARHMGARKGQQGTTDARESTLATTSPASTAQRRASNALAPAVREALVSDLARAARRIVDAEAVCDADQSRARTERVHNARSVVVEALAGCADIRCTDDADHDLPRLANCAAALAELSAMCLDLVASGSSDDDSLCIVVGRDLARLSERFAVHVARLAGVSFDGAVQ